MNARGTRRIYVGASPGVGATFAMLSEGHRRQHLRVYVHQLRRQLEPDPAAPCYFLNEPGLGYRFAG